MYELKGSSSSFLGEPHLLLHTVPSVHVFNVVEKVTDGVHEAEMLTVLVHCLQHLIEGHSNLKDKYKQTQHTFIPGPDDFSVFVVKRVCTSSMHRVLSCWKRCRNGPTR